MSLSQNSLAKQAEQNLSQLAANAYPGRGIILGRSQDGQKLFQVYWIMGRSENSRNRQFVIEGGVLKTKPLDMAKVKDPSLVIYTAMDSVTPWHVVTNGDHTDTVSSALRQGRDYRDALRSREHEPDPPHFTPRIAGGFHGTAGNAWLAIVKADSENPGRSVRQFFEYEDLPRGLGWCVTTYQGDGNPLPSFSGEPFALPLVGNANQVRDSIWANLNPENRISVAVKEVATQGSVTQIVLINQYTPSK